MKGKWLGVVVLAVLAVGMLNTSSCAREQKLESITLSPAGGFVFGGFGATGQFTAYGNFVHRRRPRMSPPWSVGQSISRTSGRSTNRE